MRILLDTHTFLWLSTEAPQLSKTAKAVFLDNNNDFLLSLASIWEMATKISLKKLNLKLSLDNFILQQLQENSISQLPISFRHIVKVTSLDFHHRDPFDRLLIAQSLEDDLIVLSADNAFDHYGVKRIW